MSAKFIPVEKITLLYICPECSEEVEQPLAELVEVGTPFCPECDVDMEMNDAAKVSDWLP